MKKMDRLRKNYIKAVEEDNYFRINELSLEIRTIQRKRIYGACVKNLRMSPYYSNYLTYCKHFTDEVMNEVLPEEEGYEIGSYYTKDGIPCVVYFN